MSALVCYNTIEMQQQLKVWGGRSISPKNIKNSEVERQDTGNGKTGLKVLQVGFSFRLSEESKDLHCCRLGFVLP